MAMPSVDEMDILVMALISKSRELARREDSGLTHS